MKKNVRCTITDFDKNSMWVEENHIPYKRKVYIKKNQSNIYENCLLTNDNISCIDNLPKNINLDEDTLKVYKNDIIRIYSDGGSFNNGHKDQDKPMFGSIAYIITLNGEEVAEVSYGIKEVTNNYCEVNSFLKAYEEMRFSQKFNLKDPIFVSISDSQYLTKGISEWLDGWIKRGWKNNEGKPTLNKESWMDINKYRQESDIFVSWVKGHQDNDNHPSIIYNNRCDFLCNQSINELLAESGLPLRKL